MEPSISIYRESDSRTGKSKVRSEGWMRKHLGPFMLNKLEESGSLSCGSTIYSVEPRHNEGTDFDEYGSK